MSKTILYLENIINNRTNIIKTYILLDYLLSHGFRINIDTFFKYVFIVKVQEYLSTDYNVIDLKNQYSIPNKLKSKYQYAIQLTYPYLGSDDSKLGKEVISLYFVDNKSEVVHYKRIWEEL